MDVVGLACPAAPVTSTAQVPSRICFASRCRLLSARDTRKHTPTHPRTYPRAHKHQAAASSKQSPAETSTKKGGVRWSTRLLILWGLLVPTWLRRGVPNGIRPLLTPAPLVQVPRWYFFSGALWAYSTHSLVLTPGLITSALPASALPLCMLPRASLVSCSLPCPIGIPSSQPCPVANDCAYSNLAYAWGTQRLRFPDGDLPRLTCPLAYFSTNRPVCLN